MNQPKEVAPTPSTALDIVREYHALQKLEKDLEKRKNLLKPKLNMLIAADADARSFDLPEVPEGKFIARRVESDRRKMDDDLLLALVQAHNAPSEAFTIRVNEDYLAKMIQNGEITKAELETTLVGKILKYVTLTFKKNSEPE